MAHSSIKILIPVAKKKKKKKEKKGQWECLGGIR